MAKELFEKHHSYILNLSDEDITSVALYLRGKLMDLGIQDTLRSMSSEEKQNYMDYIDMNKVNLIRIINEAPQNKNKGNIRLYRVGESDLENSSEQLTNNLSYNNEISAWSISPNLYSSFANFMKERGYVSNTINIFNVFMLDLDITRGKFLCLGPFDNNYAQTNEIYVKLKNKLSTFRVIEEFLDEQQEVIIAPPINLLPGTIEKVIYENSNKFNFIKVSEMKKNPIKFKASKLKTIPARLGLKYATIHKEDNGDIYLIDKFTRERISDEVIKSTDQASGILENKNYELRLSKRKLDGDWFSLDGGKNRRKKLTKKKPVKKRRHTKRRRATKRRRPTKRRRAGKSSHTR